MCLNRVNPALASKLEGNKAVGENKAGLNFGQEIQRDQRYIPSNYSSYIYTSPRVCEMLRLCDVKCHVFVM